MMRNSLYRQLVLLQQRNFLLGVFSCSSSTFQAERNLISTATASITTFPKKPSSIDRFCIAKPYLQFQRPFSSSGPSNIVYIKSEEEFNSSLCKVQDGLLPAIYYFTAVWCGPCRFISPVVEELSTKYPHVTTYKIDIDEEGLRNTLGKCNITAVPTLQLFQNGKKQAEIVGADITSLKNTAEKLYKKD